jgi:prepilin-type N-terminal cleavage/methylation domain-containing protein
MSTRLIRDDQAFTLVELAVVILIIGILLGLALPAFFGMRGNADDRVAQANLRQTRVSAVLWQQDRATFNLTPQELQASEPALSYTQAAGLGLATFSAGPAVVVYFGDTTSFGEVARSKSGRCFLEVEFAGAASIRYRRDTSSSTDCTLPASLAAPGGAWEPTS